LIFAVLYQDLGFHLNIVFLGSAVSDCSLFASVG